MKTTWLPSAAGNIFNSGRPLPMKIGNTLRGNMIQYLANNFDVLMCIVLGGLAMSFYFVSPDNASEAAAEPGRMRAGEKRRGLVLKLGGVIFAVGIGRLVWGSMHQGPYTLHSGGYAVTFPGWTQEELHSQDSPMGILTLHYARYTDSDTDTTDVSAYVDIGSDRDISEQATIRGLAGAVGRQLSEDPIELDGWHGKEVVFDTQDAHHLTARVFIGKTRTYFVMEGVPDSTWSPLRKSDFLDSFHFEKP